MTRDYILERIDMIQNERIKSLNQKGITSGSYVLYWMQASQRVQYNHALEFAIQQANERGAPVIVYFGLTDRYPDANERRYCFMLEGLKEVQTLQPSRFMMPNRIGW